jgi:hypothetical protein
MIMAARIARAQHKAAAVRAPQTETITILFARRAPSFGGDFRSLLAEGPNLNAMGMRLEHGEPPRTAPAPALPGRAAAAWRALEPLLATRIDQAHRRVHALGGAVRQAAAAIAQQLKPELQRGMGLAVQRAHALGSMAWQWLLPALERGIDRTTGHARALGVTVRELSIAAWQRLAPALARTMDRARRRIGALGIAARVHGLARWRQLRLALVGYADQAQRRAHAIGVAARALGVAAWQAPASRFVMAGTTVIAAAIAAWCLMQPHEMVPPAVVPPDIAGPPPVLPLPQGAGAPTTDHPLPTQTANPPAFDQVLRPPGSTPAEPSPAPEAGGLAEAFPAPRLKPPLPLPTLVAELKPARRTPEPPPDSPLIEAKPLPPLPVPPQTRESPGEMRDDPRAVDNMLSDMLGTGAKRKQRRWR